MLTGRESLIRLIGKRRKFLPNFNRIVSFSSHGSYNQNDSTLNSTSTNDDSSISYAAGVVTEDGYVGCPVCGTKIRGDDFTVNSHLDSCLVRGTKRKLSQQTLHQFSFCSQLKIKTCVDEVVCVGNDQYQVGPNHEPKDVPELSSSMASQVNCDNIQRQLAGAHDSSLCKPSLVEGSITQCNSEGSVDSTFANKIVSSMADPPPVVLGSGLASMDVAGAPSLLSGVAFETFIVGRKYCDAAEIISGASISLLRDPFNIKDPNAIKVVYVHSDSNRVLGFLPRELAQHLSRLMDDYKLKFEGQITSTPKISFDVVPIEIMCLQTPYYKGLGNHDLLTLKSLCEGVLRSIGNKSPPTTAKYQQNFCLMIQEALRSNHHLFTHDEKFLLESFGSISDDGQRLFVRLYSRKGPWFRASNLSYSEILDCQQAVKELSEASFFHSLCCGDEVDDNDMKELLSILTVSELSAILRSLKKDSIAGMRKKDFIASLHSSYKTRLCPQLPTLILDTTGTCIQISSTAESLMWRVQRLFFLNGEQDLSAFLLVDLGRVKYPEYKCIISDPAFIERKDLLAYEEAIEVAQIMDQAFDEENSELVVQCIKVAECQLTKNQLSTQVLAGTFLQQFSASWVYSKVVLLGVSYLEKEHRYQDAMNLLKMLLSKFTSDGRRGYWILRLSIDLEHLGYLEESLTVAEDGVAEPWVRAGSKMALQRRVLRLSKPPRRWKLPSYAASVKRKINEVHIQGRPLSSKVGTKSRFYGEDGKQCGVEELALEFYAGEGGGWQGVHTESGIWLTIFGLLMWDVIFADVPNVFRTRFQNAPLDMGTDNFYVARASLIESHLQNIQEGMAEAILIMSWESHFGTVCRGVNWEKHTLSELRAVVTCIGGPCLANMCRQLAQDYRSWSSGMPDLLLWRFHGDYSGEAKLVEVKGPKDRLSEQQRAWLLALMDCGFSAEVCKVNPPPNKSNSDAIL